MKPRVMEAVAFTEHHGQARAAHELLAAKWGGRYGITVHTVRQPVKTHGVKLMVHVVLAIRSPEAR